MTYAMRGYDSPVKVMVTGGAGHIGSHLVDLLVEQGYEVTVIDDLSVGSVENLRDHLERRSVRFIRGSVTDEPLVSEASQGCRIIYHLAAVVGTKRVSHDPLTTIFTNVRGTEAVCKAAHQTGCKVVLASSSEVYGKSAKIPFREDDDRVLGPPRVARWCYAAAKALDEHLALAYGRAGLPVVVLRYFNTYGPRLDINASVVGRFIWQALNGAPLTVHGDGQHTRCFTYVEDTVRGTLMASLSPQAEGEVINIGADRELSIMALAKKVIEVTGSSSGVSFVPYSEEFGAEFEDPARRVPDVTKAQRLLGFKASIPLEEGLRRTAQWMAQR